MEKEREREREEGGGGEGRGSVNELTIVIRFVSQMLLYY